jgi:ribose/xylose/arabinose/galactoside ABC-type transport system permease subunit
MPPPKFSFSLSKFPEGGLILVIIGLGILLTAFGGTVQRPKLERGPDGAPRRVMTTNAAGDQVPAFVQVNKFLNAATLTQIAKDTSFFAIMAISMTLVIIILGIDLSVGSIYALSAIAGAMLMNHYGPNAGAGAAWQGVALTLLVGALCGLVNGAMIVGFNVHPFIITLGTMAIYRGIAFVTTKGQSIGDFPQEFRTFMRSGVGDLSLVPLIVMVVVCIVGGIFLSRMTLGRKIYAIGGNETASRYSGIRVGPIKLMVYVLSGLTAAISATLALGYYGAASSGDGQGYELNVIAAAVVGGASLAGGKGTALGALLGAIILQMISAGMVILGIPQEYSQIVTGAVVIAAVLLDQLNRWLGNRRLLAKTARVKKEVVAAAEAPAQAKP